jgi:hypothetical protein
MRHLQAALFRTVDHGCRQDRWGGIACRPLVGNERTHRSNSEISITTALPSLRPAISPFLSASKMRVRVRPVTIAASSGVTAILGNLASGASIRSSLLGSSTICRTENARRSNPESFQFFSGVGKPPLIEYFARLRTAKIDYFLWDRACATKSSINLWIFWLSLS